MRRELITVVRWLGLSILATGCLGCGMSRVSLVDTGALRLESSVQGKVDVAWSDAYKQADGFVVTGVVRRNDTVGLPIEATVAVEIVSLAGVVLDKAESNILCIPRRRVNRVQGFQRFAIRFPQVPPEGSSVRILACGTWHR